MFSTGNNVQGKRTSVKRGLNRNTSHNVAVKDVEEDCISSVEQNYGNRLLGLRAALNEKELQLVELREQHLSVVNRAAIARQNWEDAITSKDQVIVQLQKALHLKKCEVDRQERVNEENVRRLLHQRQEEENAELLQKQRNISLLEQKNTQFVEELVDQQKTITKLRRLLEGTERHRASYLHKMDVVNVKVQDLKAALQKKEEAVETQKKYCQELKGMVWKRDAMIGQLQLAEQQLQSSLARQEAEREALQCLNEKVQDEKAQAEKNLEKVKANQGHLDLEALHKEYEKGLLVKEVFLHKQRRQIHDLQKTLQSTEMALRSKHEDRHHVLEENKRLMNSYDSLRHNFEQAQQKQQLLELHLKAAQERLSTAERIVAETEQSIAVESTRHAICSDGSITEDQAPNNGVEDIGEERESMASIGSSAMKLASCPSIPSGRDKVSCGRGQEIPRRLETSRAASAERNGHLPTTEFEKVALYSSFPETANKTERKACTVESTIKSYSYPSGTNIHLDQTAEARTSTLSESSQRSSPYSKVGLDSSSEIDGMTGEDRSSTPPEIFQTVSLAERKKTSLTSSNPRKRTNCHGHRSPCAENSRSKAFLPTNHSSNILFAANDSLKDAKRNWMFQNLEVPHTSRPAEPLSSVKKLNRIPNLKIPRSPGSPEQSEISGSLSLEFQSCSYPVASRGPKAGKPFNQGKGYSPNKLSRPLSDVPRKMFQTVVKPPTTGTQGRSSKKGESMKPPTPASTNIQASCDTALKSLQDEVMKRERSWRRTEANMRAALCQRLTELKDAEKLNLEMVGLYQREGRQKIKQWKT